MGSYIEDFQDDRKKESDIIVTVDGPSGAGKGTLAQQIADELGVEHFSAGDVFRGIAEEKNISHTELAEQADKEVDIEVDRRTLERGLEQSCVIDGRLPSWALGDFSDLRIHVDADEEERAGRIAEREEIDKETALEEEVRKRDRENNRRYQEYYSINTSNLEIYDLVIDNTDLNIEEQNRLVKEVLAQVFPERTED